MLGLPIILRNGSVWLGVLLLTSLASQQNLLGLVHAWFAIPVRIVGLTLFSIGVLYYCAGHAKQTAFKPYFQKTIPVSASSI
jgi:hypothetical protein